MPRIEKSIAMAIGIVFAAVYVLLLLGFTREYYTAKNPTNPASLTMPAQGGRLAPQPSGACTGDERVPCVRPARAD